MPTAAHDETPKTLADKFDADIKKITQERGKVYGHPLDDFTLIANLKEEAEACSDLVLRHVIEMIMVKLARLIKSPEHYDSWLDIAGYSRTACMVMDKRKSFAAGRTVKFSAAIVDEMNKLSEEQIPYLKMEDPE